MSSASIFLDNCVDYQVILGLSPYKLHAGPPGSHGASLSSPSVANYRVRLVKYGMLPFFGHL